MDVEAPGVFPWILDSVVFRVFVMAAAGAIRPRANVAPLVGFGVVMFRIGAASIWNAKRPIHV